MIYVIITKKEIATNNIIKIAIVMKSDKNDDMVSGIIPRNDKCDVKGSEVNNLISLCSTYNFRFIDNSNINVNHLNTSSLHVNYKGTYVLGGNLKPKKMCAGARAHRRSHTGIGEIENPENQII